MFPIILCSYSYPIVVAGGCFTAHNAEGRAVLRLKQSFTFFGYYRNIFFGWKKHIFKE